MVQLGHALTTLKDPPVKALHVYHCNPAVVAPDSAQVLSGLERKDLFTVVHEHLLTETANYADIVLPATTSMESTDLYRSYGHYYLQMARPVIAPVGEARSTLSIFQELANRMGLKEECFRETEEEIIRRLLQSESQINGRVSVCGSVPQVMPLRPCPAGRTFAAQTLWGR